MPRDSQQWLSTDEAAKRIGVTARTLYRFIDAGELVAYRFGRVIRLQPDDVEVFIKARRIQPGGLRNLWDPPGGDGASDDDQD